MSARVKFSPLPSATALALALRRRGRPAGVLRGLHALRAGLRGEDTLLVRFTAVSLAVTVVIAVGFGLLLSRKMVDDALDEAARDAAQTVGILVSPHVRAEDFAAPTPARIAAWRARVGQVVGGEIVRVKVWDDRGRVLYSDESEIIGQRFPPGEQEELHAALGGRLARELSRLEKAENTAERGYGQLLEVYVPVRLPGSDRVVGVFEVYRSFAPLARRVREIERLVWGGSAIAFGLLYTSLHALARQASRQMARLASFPIHSPNPILETTLAGEVTYVNPAAAAQFPDVRARGPRHPLLHDLDAVAGELARHSQRPVIREVRVGDTIYQQVISCLPDAGRIRIYALDVTERRRAEEGIRRHLQRLDALRTVDKAITASLDLRVTLSVVLDQVVTHLRADAADILLLNPHTQTLEYAAGRGFRTQALQHTHLPVGASHAGRAALERRPISIPNIAEAPGEFTRAPLLAAEGFVAYDAVPLAAKGLVKGVLEIFHRSPVSPDDEWLRFLEALAGQAAIAIDNAALFNDLQVANARLALAYDSTLEGWSRALDLRDQETEGHTQRVAELTVQLARAMGIGDADLVHLRRGALLHDIGKMGIPDSILHKPGPLSEAEWAIMRQHPVYAYELLSPIEFLRPALDIPYSHHERWDGSGYPRGLRGEAIPPAARIFAVVDVWDALLSARPYRPAWPRAQALAYIRAQAGKQFDPRVVEAFLRLVERGEL